MSLPPPPRAPPHLIEISEPDPAHCPRASLPPEGNVKHRNYRQLSDNIRAYTPTGDIHTSPEKNKTVSRFDVCADISPPRAKILELLRPDDPGREALEAIVRPAPRRGLVRPLDDDTRRFLQRALLSPSPQGLSLANTPEPHGRYGFSPEPYADYGLSPEPYEHYGHSLEPHGHYGRTLEPHGHYGRSPEPHGNYGRSPEPHGNYGRSPEPAHREEARDHREDNPDHSEEYPVRRLECPELRVESPDDHSSPSSGTERSLAEELREAECGGFGGWRSPSTGWCEEDSGGAEERERLGRLALAVEEEEAGAGAGGLSIAARRLDALLAESRLLHQQLAGIHEDMQTSSARAGRCAERARALSAETRALCFLDDVVALLRGDVASASRARSWPFALGPRLPDRNYVI